MVTAALHAHTPRPGSGQAGKWWGRRVLRVPLLGPSQALPRHALLGAVSLLQMLICFGLENPRTGRMRAFHVHICVLLMWPLPEEDKLLLAPTCPGLPPTGLAPWDGVYVCTCFMVWCVYVL